MVVVVILQTRKDSNSTCIKTLFNNSYYSNVTELPFTNSFDYRKALEYCYNTASTQPCLLIQDTSVTNLTSSELTLAIQQGLSTNVDMVFLCKWLDACDKSTPINKERVCRSSLMTTINPTSLQAVVYTPVARDYLINQIIDTLTNISTFINTQLTSGQLKAVTYTPNIIDFDITLATTPSDYSKLNECLPVNTSSKAGSNTATLMIFFIIILVTLAVGWSILYLSGTWGKMAS